jgi:chlorobactene glucosyltransferase
MRGALILIGDVLMHILEILLAVSLLFWVGLGIFWFWNLRGTKILTAEEQGQPPERWPRVSILVPARNEEAVLASCLESLLKLDYPEFDILLVDDDSRDRTGEIADDYARRPDAAGRLRVIHNRELPAGWSGKVHALSLAAQAATGEWLLATDADVVFNPAVLRAAMRRAVSEGADLLSLGLEFEYGSFWEKIILPAFTLLLSTLFPLRQVNSSRSRRAIAAGAFILMRAAEFRALGGYERMRQTLVEDLRTAELFKRGGRRIRFIPSRGLLTTRMYANAGELFEGLSRSAFEGAGFSLLKVLAGLAAGFLTAILPWAVALGLGLERVLSGRSAHGAALTLAIVACLFSALVYSPLLIYLRVSPLYALVLPLAAIFYSAVAINSVLRSLAGGGVPWKERTYRPPE